LKPPRRPDGKADPTVQDAVHIITIGMADIKPGDGVMACLLFPLFIVATAAITPEDRDTISAHFKRLRAWSSLGNIDLTFKIVQKIWKDHDENVTGSWVCMNTFPSVGAVKSLAWFVTFNPQPEFIPLR
jgi:hypothetical protein